MSLRLRLTLWNVSVLALAFLALGMFLRKRTEFRVRGDIDRQLMTPAHRLPRGLGSPPLSDRPDMPSDRQQGDEAGGPPDDNGGPSDDNGRPSDDNGRPPDHNGGPPRDDERNPPPDRPDFRHRGPSFRPPPPPRPLLYGPQGEPLFEGGAAPYRQGILEAAATHKPNWVDINGERIYTYPFLSNRSGRWDFFQNKASLEPISREVDNITRDLLILLPFALALAGAGGLFLTSRVLHPLRALTEATGRIGASDLSERLPVLNKNAHKDEMGKLSLTFNAMLERLETAFNQQKRFVADASHELRSPLTVIKTSAELGMTDPNLPPDAKSLFARIDRAADRTNRLVQNLLLLARGDGRGLNINATVFPTTTLFTNAVEEAKARRPESAKIVLEVPSSNHTLTGDAPLLHQVLVNLLDNALRHTPKEGNITLAAIESGFTVTDTGVGILAEHLPHLGERFYRVDAARARSEGGTGLGLSICRSIIEAHHGTLAFSSPVDTNGSGTRVTVQWN
jgi:signal transduction histidine kinase